MYAKLTHIADPVSILARIETQAQTERLTLYDHSLTPTLWKKELLLLIAS